MLALTCWLLTYLLHSTLLLGTAALVCLVLRGRRLALQEAILRAALLGGFLTASLQLGLGLQPLGGQLPLLAERPAPALATAGRTGDFQPTVQVQSIDPGARLLDGARRVAATDRVSWRSALAVAWGLFSFLALARLAVAAARLAHLLRDRRPLGSGGLAPRAQHLAEALGIGRTVRLSSVPRLPAPLARGVLHPEVCLPERVLAELGEEEQLAICAHEMAHVARGDSAWSLFACLVEAVAPVQPLNLWARRRLQELAEYLSDDLAVATAGRPLGLARSLVEVASWLLTRRTILPAVAPGALSTRSRLGHRVERLMDPMRSPELPRRSLLPLATMAVLVMALVAPAVSGQPPQEPPAAQPPAVPSVQAAPTSEAPPAPTASPAPRPVPKGQRSEAERKLEQLTEKLSRRSEEHAAEMEKLEAEIEAFTSKFQPRHDELARLGEELGRQMEQLVQAEGDDEAQATTRRRVEELKAEIRQAAESVRLSEEDRKGLQEKARRLAELVKPSQEDLREIARLAQATAKESMPDELEQMMDQAMKLARTAMREGREQMQRAREEMQRAREEMQRAREKDEPSP